MNRRSLPGLSLAKPSIATLLPGMLLLGTLLLGPLLPGMGACASLQPSNGATFVVVRHAEKIDDGSRDPALSGRGQSRARALARRLVDAPVVAVYATAFRRSRQTGQPTAAMHQVAVTPYDASTPAADFAARLRARHPAGTVLVVGHSNTVPQIVAALCGCRVEALGENDYDVIHTIRIGRDGGATLQVGRQPDPPPSSGGLE